MKPIISVNRIDFVKKFMEMGLTYGKACKVYECMVRVFEDGICSGSRINIGNVCSITPQRKEPRTVRMGFQKTAKIYYLGSRIRYRVNLFREFIQTHNLKWFS